MRRPLWSVALFYVAGVTLARWFSVPVMGLLLLCATVLLGACIWPKARPILLASALVLLGWLYLESRTTIFSPHDLRVHFDEHPQLVTLRGRLDEAPSLTVFERRDEEAWHNIFAEVGVAHPSTFCQHQNLASVQIQIEENI